MNKTVYFSITLVAVVLGLMVAVQFRTTHTVEHGVPIGREHELTMEKRQLEKDMAQLREEVDDLTAKLAEASKGYSEATGVLNSEYLKIRAYAGLTDVEGPGVEVLLESTNPNIYSVKDDDLLKVINDLRGAGAEAIAVNEQRILATSEVRQAGSHINVNLAKITEPYIITAVGKAITLKSSLEIKGGLVENLLQDRGIEVKVEAKDNILIPAFTGALQFDYAKPTQRG